MHYNNFVHRFLYILHSFCVSDILPCMDTDKQKNISIGEAAEILGVSIDTLRRWDNSGKFPAEKTEGGHRLYSRQKIDLYLSDVFTLAEEWCARGGDISERFYCSNSAVFNARLEKMLPELEKNSPITPLLLVVAGEIGNNSFDHNIGNWPDVPGIFFAYDLIKKKIALADRGVGILATLRRVRPELQDNEQALSVAFNEFITGRAPEDRGNGLKLVKRVVRDNPIGLRFQTGDFEASIDKNGDGVLLKPAKNSIRGCLALITF